MFHLILLSSFQPFTPPPHLGVHSFLFFFQLFVFPDIMISYIPLRIPVFSIHFFFSSFSSFFPPWHFFLVILLPFSTSLLVLSLFSLSSFLPLPDVFPVVCHPSLSQREAELFIDIPGEGAENGGGETGRGEKEMRKKEGERK